MKQRIVKPTFQTNSFLIEDDQEEDNLTTSPSSPNPTVENTSQGSDPAENPENSDFSDWKKKEKKKMSRAAQFANAKASGVLLFRTFNNCPDSLEFLLGKHSKTNSWENFAGKVNMGETVEEAALRELQEETLNQFSEELVKMVASQLNIERAFFIKVNQSNQAMFLVHLNDFKPDLEEWKRETERLKSENRKVELSEFNFFKEFPLQELRVPHLQEFIPKKRNDIMKMALEIIKCPTRETTSTKHNVTKKNR